MFIDSAIVILAFAVMCLWVCANVIVVFNYSLRTMANEFWVEQTWVGKICANAFYSLAWVISGLLTLGAILLGAVLCAFSKWYEKYKPTLKSAMDLEL
jgi:hypothetical protein